jgi:hypothetical protein
MGNEREDVEAQGLRRLVVGREPGRHQDSTPVEVDLSDEERFDLYSAAVEEVGDRATVIAGTGTYSTAHSVHLTRHAHDLGVDGFLIVTPYYNKPPPRGIVEHVKAIAAVTDKPIVYYNIPARVVKRAAVANMRTPLVDVDGGLDDPADLLRTRGGVELLLLEDLEHLAPDVRVGVRRRAHWATFRVSAA